MRNENMASKLPMQIKAAAELELRKREKGRLTSCSKCAALVRINKIYKRVLGQAEMQLPEICKHSVSERQGDLGDPEMVERLNRQYDAIRVANSTA